MFAYCGNNPVCRNDDTGTYYTSAQIHNFVVDDICENNPHKAGKETYIKYYEKVKRGKKWYTFGYCDVYDTVTHEVWEVKRLSGGSTCSPAAAGVQLANYVLRGYLKHHEDFDLKFGGAETTIQPNIFTKRDNDGRGMSVVGYFDAGNGLVYYDYQYIPSADEAFAAGCAVIGLLAILSGFGAIGTAGALPGLIPT